MERYRQHENSNQEQAPENSPEILVPHSISGNIVEYSHQDALASESYEHTSQALDEVEALQNYRKRLKELPCGSFYSVFEDVTNINNAPIPDKEKIEKVSELCDVLEEKTTKFSPRVADLYFAILSQIRGDHYEPKFELTQKKILELEVNNDLLVLNSDQISWELKFNRIETRLAGYLAGVRALDRREGNVTEDQEGKEREERSEKLKNAPINPPERRSKSKPSMDELDRLKEGEKVRAIWSIFPAYGGYFREQSFSVWNSSNNEWVEEEYQYHDPDLIPLCKQEKPKEGLFNITMSSDVPAGRWVSIPMPYTHGLHQVDAGAHECRVQQDQNGDMVVRVEGNGTAEIKVILAPLTHKIYGPTDELKIRAPKMSAHFQSDTTIAIDGVAKTKRGNIPRAKIFASYTRRRLRYSNNSKYNQIYDTHPDGYFAGIDEYKEADCDVGNTYFAGLNAQLDIPVRHCVGHSVKGKDAKGASAIHSGTGHAWSEVWDERNKQWVRIDATPPGDPSLEESEDQGGGSSTHGDYGTQEAVRPTDEALEKLAQKLREHKEQLSYTKDERKLAEATGIDLKEARKIVKEIKEAESTRLPGGELVVDVLARLFNAIVESRKAVAQEYTGPVRKSEGGESIQQIVRHKIGSMSGDTDPVSREKPSEEDKQEDIFGGFDLYMIGDKSGSMGATADGETLWQLQRRAEYLIFSSLFRFEQAIKRSGISQKETLSVRTQGISFRGSGADEIDLDKPLSGSFSPEDKVKLWHSLTNQGVGNGDTAALSYILRQIKQEIKDQKGTPTNRLRLIIVCSDGGPDNPAEVQRLAEELGQLNAVVVGMGLTETAAAVPIIYNTPYSRGDIARDINDLPALVAKHVVSEAIRLFPKQGQESAKTMIQNIIGKFKHIK